MTAVLLVARLTWNLVGATLFIGLPSDVTVQEVCVEWTTCVTPDNPVVVVLPWASGSPSSVSARFVRSDGSLGWQDAVPVPGFTG
jgi:hypothetical protein